MRTVRQNRGTSTRLATAIMAGACRRTSSYRNLPEDSLTENYRFAFERRQRAAALGDVASRNALAIMFLEPASGAPDFAGAVRLLIENASQRDLDSMFLLGLLLLDEHYRGHYADQVFRLWHTAAGSELAIAQYGAAVMLEHGLGTEVSEREASFWYSRAAANDLDQGLARLLDTFFSILDANSSRRTPMDLALRERIPTEEFERIPSGIVL